MKKMIIGLALAISLMAGVAGSAAARGPDDHACGAASATPGITALAGLGGCEDHTQ